jgi:hypothetical protein
LRSKEATSAAVAWGTTFLGSALQSYGVGALINATGTLSYKGAAYLGALIFAASNAPTVSFLFSTFRSFLVHLTGVARLCGSGQLIANNLWGKTVLQRDPY